MDPQFNATQSLFEKFTNYQDYLARKENKINPIVKLTDQLHLAW